MKQDRDEDQARYEHYIEADLPSAYRFALSLTGSPDDAWDLTQDTMMRVATVWPRVHVDTSPVPYTRRIMLNLSRNRYRRFRRDTALISKLRVETVRTEAAFDSLDLPDWLAEAYKKLSERQRSSVALVHVWGYSITETAELLSCRPNTVKTHLGRALTTLRRAAQLACESEPDEEIAHVSRPRF